MIAEAEAAAGLSDVAAHGSKHHHHPMHLLVVLSALNTPAAHQHGALFTHQVSQTLDGIGLNTTDLLSPGRGLRHTVGFAEHVSNELIVAHRVLTDEFAIHLAGAFEFVRHCDHHGHIGTGLRSDPFTVLAEVFGCVGFERIDGNHRHAGFLHHFHAFGVFVNGRHPVDIVGNRRIGTPHHEKLAFLSKHFPGRLLFVDTVGTDHIGKDHLFTTRGVVAVVAGKTAIEVEHALHQVAGRTKITGTHPAVAAAVNRHGAILFTNALEFRSNELQSLVPGDTNEGVRTTAFAAGFVALFQIALANHRVADAGSVVRLLCDCLQLQRRCLIEFDRIQAFDLAAVYQKAPNLPHTF